MEESDRMKLLEMCSGSGVMSETFKNNGWDTLSIDNNPKLGSDIVMDCNHITTEFIKNINPDVIWFSPPCTTYSIAAISHHRSKTWNTLLPKTMEAYRSDVMIGHIISTVHQYISNSSKPILFFIENPRGGLRKMLFMNANTWLTRYTITYCQYGDHRMKPTDIWCNLDYIQFKPMCHNGDKCHEASPRGSKTGTQGLKNAYERGKIPIQFCESIAKISNEVLQ